MPASQRRIDEEVVSRNITRLGQKDRWTTREDVSCDDKQHYCHCNYKRAAADWSASVHARILPRMKKPRRMRSGQMFTRHDGSWATICCRHFSTGSAGIMMMGPDLVPAAALARAGKF